MVSSALLFASVALAGLAKAQCPFADGGHMAARSHDDASRDHVARFDVDDAQGFLSSDAGGPMEDQESLRAGERGPTLLEDFILRQKITHFDHERVPERAVHARGAGAYGTFTSYGDFGNMTAASFLGAAGKTTPTFVRFSTVAGSRGSADTARDVHGFATRFYTDEGNFDIVGNNVPVFFIQDAIQFPDLVHSVKPSPDSEIPQAATAHDSAWDFFSQQTTTLHTLFWAMAGHGIPRSYRHMDGFGVHTFRFVTDDGHSKLIKWHWKTRQGKASLVWDEAQHVSGKNPDFHRDDLWRAIDSGNGPEWELCAQVFDEEMALSFGFDVLDPTKMVPEELVPLTRLGVMKLDANPVNYFAETEQIMFQPGHIVRGIDFTEDPLLQGRVFSYLDTQLNRHGGPNFEQLPINRPVTSIHNNNRDGAGQNLIHRNIAPYTPNTLNKGYPLQANQAQGRGFFTAPDRSASGHLRRRRPSTFADHFSQPRLFFNSISKVEQQFLVDAIRFETSQVRSVEVRRNVLAALNRVSHDIAVRVGQALGLEAPPADDTFYHDNVTTGVGAFGDRLPTISTLTVGILASAASEKSMVQATQLKSTLEDAGLVVTIVGEAFAHGVDTTYTGAEAVAFDAVVVTAGADLFALESTLFPLGRPAQIVTDAFHWGKPVGFLGEGRGAAGKTGVRTGEGVYYADTVGVLAEGIKEGLAVFRFTDRFPLDH